MGAGLKLDRALAWVTCALTWRLLGIAMPLTIALLAVLGHALLGLGAAAAILLGAALAPTDPVLASDVQVGPPGEGLEDEVRFTLTSEAGLNDGLAFPFVNLAIALALAGQTGEPWLVKWLTVDVLWKLSAGLVAGWIVGRVLGWLTFRLPNRAKLSRTGDGFVALGITCLAYGLTEMIHGYGFLAVFVAALGLRSAERNSKYHEKLHDFAEQLERLTMMMLLVLFGGAIADGGLFRAVSFEVVVYALLAVFLVRPLSGWISLLGRDQRPRREGGRSASSASGDWARPITSPTASATPSSSSRTCSGRTTGLIVLISILLHGTTVTPVMRYLDRQRQKRGDSVEAMCPTDVAPVPASVASKS